ncbi:LytR/AlgR family response regulator transcription factor [Amorphus sp. MBR-141]
MLRLMLVDDEPPARRAMRRLLAAHPDVEIVAEAGTVAAAAEAATDTRPDLILLDIGLTDGEGFDLVAALPGSAAIVFVTAHSAFAARAFDVAAVDYLLKPVDPARLATALDRVRTRLGPVESAGDGARPTLDLDHRLALTANGTTSLVPVATLAFLTAEADFTRLHLVDGRQSLVCRLMKLFEEELPTPPFLRVSRSVILNLDHVGEVERTGDGGARVSMRSGQQTVDLGRIPARRLLAGLKGLSGERDSPVRE